MAWNSTTSREGTQYVSFHRPTFRLPRSVRRDPSECSPPVTQDALCLPRRPLPFAPNMTLIYPIDAVCVDMAERWRQLRETERAERQRLMMRIENAEDARWERLCRHWASKHPGD
jgi:hypothetical protein